MRARKSTIYACMGFLPALLPLAPGQTKPSVPSHSFAVLIGVQDYSGSGLDELGHASGDTDLFLRHLSSDRGGSVNQDSIRKFVTPSATGAGKNQILAALRDIITQEAGGNDVIYLLITARIEVPVQSDELFINVAKSAREKSDSQISLTELETILREKRASRKIVFAELSGKGDTEIGSRMRRHLSLENLSGVVAAESEASAQSVTSLNGGHRVFPYLLVSGLQANNGKYDNFQIDQDANHLLSYAEIQNFLEKYVPEYTKRAGLSPRIIQRFGDQKATDVLVADLSKKGLSELAFAPQRYGNLLAANRDFAGLNFALSDVPDQSQISPEAKSLLDRLSMDLQIGNLIEPGGAYDVLKQLRGLLTDASHKNRLDLQQSLLSAALQDQGQEQITRYGIGDRFTLDPKWEETEAKPTDYQNAEKAFKLSLELMPPPKNADWFEARRHFCLGRIAMISGKPDEALKEFETASNLDQGFAEPRNAVGVINFQASHFEEALKQFDAAKKRAPLWAYPRHNSALAYIELGRYDQAESEYRAAIAQTPYYPYLHYNLGVLLQRLNRPREAEALYETTLKIFKDQEDAADARAKGWGTAGNGGEHDRADLQAQLLKRNLASVYVALGSVLDQGKNKDEALRYYKLASASENNFIAANHNLALLQKEQFLDLNAAVGLLETNVNKYSYEPSRLALADTYLQLGRYSEAEAQYKKIGPGNLSAISGLAKAQAGQGRQSEAIKAINEVVQSQKASGFVSPELLLTLGDLYESQSDLPAACEQFRSAAKTLRELPDENTLGKVAGEKLRNCKSASRRH
jgi:tetratricopeptide (TPR) repeat protein